MSDEPPSPTVLLSNRQEVPVHADELVALAVRTLSAEGVRDGELSVSLVTIPEITELHERYANEAGPTDVLSFPQDEAVDGQPRLLGDVVICPGVAVGQNPDAAAEVRLLLVHGILHLLGYDHETDGERAEMWARQERYSGVRA